MPGLTAAALILGLAEPGHAQQAPPGPEPGPTRVTPPAQSEAAAAKTPTDGAKEPASLWERERLTGDWYGLRVKLEDAGVKPGAQYQSEFWANMAGGLRRGQVYTGLVSARLAVDLDKLVGWTGGKFYTNGFYIHGRGPTATLAGNIQAVSNLEAAGGYKLYNLWFEQTLLEGKFSVRLGQQGLNDEFMISQYGALFLNASFGFPALAALYLPSGGPNYPLAAAFARFKYQPSDQLTLLGGVFEDDPAPKGAAADPQRRDRYGSAFRLNGHVLTVAEVWYGINQDTGAAGLPGTYKIGAWYSTARFQDQRFDTAGVALASPASNGTPRGRIPGYAIYGVADQMVWRRPGTKDQGIGLFLEVMGAPAAYNVSDLSVEAGLNWKAPFPSRENDVFGFAVSYVGVSAARRRYGGDLIRYTGGGSPYPRHETVLEVTYAYQALPWLILQPDAQYVINPGAGFPIPPGRAPLKNAFVAGVRAAIEF